MIHPVWITLDGPRAGREVQSFLGQARPYGVILFARHLEDPVQVRELCACIHESAPGFRPRVALDQEGGRVSRLAALGYRFPGASEMMGDPGRVRAVAADMGGVLAGLGFDVDFAPVADLGPAAAGTGLEGRVYGDDPETVTACCRAFLEGLGTEGVAGCLKHYPGLGGSGVDSHKDLPAIAGDAASRTPHLFPYEALAGEVPYVMVAHAAYESVGKGVPSSLSPEVYESLKPLGFAGLSVTDDLSMGAVAGLGSTPDLALGALRAGASLALWVGSQEAVSRDLEAMADAPDFLASAAGLPHD